MCNYSTPFNLDRWVCNVFTSWKWWFKGVTAWASLLAMTMTPWLFFTFLNLKSCLKSFMSICLSRIRYALPNQLIFLLVSGMYKFSSPIQWCSITTVFVLSLPKMPAQLKPRATPSDLPSFCLNPADWLSSGLPVLLSVPSLVSVLWARVFLSVMNKYHKSTRSCWWIALALITLLSIWSCVVIGICTDLFLRHQTQKSTYLQSLW